MDVFDGIIFASIMIIIACIRYEEYIFDRIRTKCLISPKCLNTDICMCVITKQNNKTFTLSSYEENMGGKVIHLVGYMDNVENVGFLETFPFMLV